MSKKAHGKQSLFNARITSTRKRKAHRDSLRMDLKELENVVENSLKRRATSKLSQRHSLDGNLARLQDHLLTVVDHKSRLSSSSLT